MPIRELRVHGVSGTPPRNMLYTDPLVAVFDLPPDVEVDKHVRIYELPGDRLAVGPNVTAFHWGGLTSGSWLTALWVLLLPFSFANIAGWTARRRGPWQVTAVRVFGLLLTGVFLNLALIASVDVYWQWVTGAESTAPALFRDNPNVFAGVMFLFLGWLWWGLVSWASTRSHFSVQTGRDRRRLLWRPDPDSLLDDRGPQGDDAWRDPAGTELTDPAMWDAHPILHRLRRIHFGFGYLILAFTAVAATDTGLAFGGFGLFDVPTALVLLALVVSGATLVTTGTKKGPAGGLIRRLTAWHSLVGAGALVIGSVAVMLSDIDDVSTVGHWPHIRDTSAFLLVLCVASLVVIFITAGKTSAGAATLGTLFGVIMGAAFAFIVDDIIETSLEIEGLNWAAVAILIWLLVVLLALVFMVARRARSRGNLREAIHDLTGNLEALWVIVPVAALGLALVVAQQRCVPDSTANLFSRCIQDGTLPAVPTLSVRVFVWVMFAAIVLVVAYLLWTTGRRTMALLVPVAALAIFTFLRFSGFTIGGIDLSFEDVTATARTVAIVLPAGLILTRMISGLRGSAEVRRGTGVIWDVIMFWPRWYHPMAPPSYGPHAVERLRQEIERLQNTPVDDPAPEGNQPVILSSHSQGTVISVIALALMTGATHDGDRDTYRLQHPEALHRLGLLTYGCPVGHLYDRYFPSLGFTNLSAALAEGLGVGRGTAPGRGRWTNLHRATDPIGGPLLPSIDVEVSEPVDRVDFIDGETKETLFLVFIGWLNRIRGITSPEVVQVYRMHSKYEPIETFVEARTRIESLLR